MSVENKLEPDYTYHCPFRPGTTIYKLSVKGITELFVRSVTFDALGNWCLTTEHDNVFTEYIEPRHYYTHKLIYSSRAEAEAALAVADAPYRR